MDSCKLQLQWWISNILHGKCSKIDWRWNWNRVKKNAFFSTAFAFILIENRLSIDRSVRYSRLWHFSKLVNRLSGGCVSISCGFSIFFVLFCDWNFTVRSLFLIKNHWSIERGDCLDLIRKFAYSKLISKWKLSEKKNKKNDKNISKREQMLESKITKKWRFSPFKNADAIAETVTLLFHC